MWSTIKKRYEGFLCESFARRVNVHLTSYRRDLESPGSDALLGGSRSLGRGWIELDGREILSVSGKDPMVTVTDPRDGRQQKTEAPPLTAAGRQGLFEAIECYPQLSIDQALEAESFIVRGLAMLDRRLGKRRLAALDPADDHPFVQLLWRLRRDSN